jgi:hypothetical protein
MEEAQRQYDDADYVDCGIHVYRTDRAWCELLDSGASDLAYRTS